MSTQAYIFALLSLSLLLATGMVSHAQTQNATAPISFHHLGSDQAIRFSVSSEHTSFSTAPVVFDVEVSYQPQPQVKIQMEPNASMIVAKAEKAWGRYGELTRSLQPADLQTLENFINAHRARGALAQPSSAGGGVFDLITYRTTKEGARRADRDKRECYNPLPDAAREAFVKNLIGFNG